MEIRKTRIGFAECDEPDEVCKFLNRIYDILRNFEKRISRIEEAKSKRGKDRKGANHE